VGATRQKNGGKTEMKRKRLNRVLLLWLWPVIAGLWMLGWTLKWIGERQEGAAKA